MLQAAPTGLDFQKGSTLNVESDAEFCIGNRGSTAVGYSRSIVGSISYVALYDRALRASEIEANALRLADNDD